MYTGYDVRYFNPDDGEVIFRKQAIEFFHLVGEVVRLLGREEDVLVQVCISSYVTTTGLCTDQVCTNEAHF
jgi:hypothetical protein